MFKTRSMLNYLVIGIMIFMIAMTALFIYSSTHLKNQVKLHIVQQTELVSELVTRSTIDIMASGHNEGQYSMVLGYGNIMDIEEIGIFKINGTEAFTVENNREKTIIHAREIISSERETFLKAIETRHAAGYFNLAEMTYSRYVPLRAEGSCIGCHQKPNEILGVLKIRLTTDNDFALLGYVQRLIWTLGIIVCLPAGALLVAGAIIKEKNKIYGQLKESNANLRKTYNELDGTKYYIQMILDNSRVIIVTTDTQGRIVEFNKEAENLLGYRKEEVVGKDVLMLYDNPTHRSDLMNKGRPIDNEIWEVRNREVNLRSKSGRILHVSLTLSTMVNDQGRIIGTVGVGKDISEKKMLQFKLTQSEKLAGIGTLASGIAHEINNPLAGILGMAEAIRDEDDLKLIKTYIDDIIQYSLNAKNIVKELSAYSRSAKNEAQSATDLSHILDNSIKMARHSASFAGIEIISQLSDGCFINANAIEMQQVFVNLIVNAIHAMGDRGVLTLRCWREGTFVKAMVADTGHGIPEENLTQIFDPFFTTKPVGIGTGLGLYVVYKIITKYRGNIDVKSRLNEGTSFVLEFPFIEEKHESIG